jgi:hypothetical protein
MKMIVEMKRILRTAHRPPILPADNAQDSVEATHENSPRQERWIKSPTTNGEARQSAGSSIAKNEKSPPIEGEL